MLADAFEKFRNNSLKTYELYPSHFLSAPTLRCDAMLNMTKVELELISNIGMHLFFEKSMRGGVSYVFKRYSKAGNRYLKSFDWKLEPKHIIYLEANTLYGYIMSKFLHASGFKQIDPKEFDLNKYTILRRQYFIRLCNV